MSDREPRPDGPGRSWQQTALLFGLQLTLAYAFWSYAPLIDFVRRDLRLSAAELALIPVFLEGSGLALAPLAGWWVDRVAVKVVARVLVTSSVAGLLIAGSGGEFGTVLLGLCFLGVSFVAVGPMTNRMLAARAAADRLGTAYSLKQSSVTVGTLASAVMLPQIASYAGWRTALLWAAVSTAVVGGLSVRLLADSSGRAGCRPLSGSLIGDFVRQLAVAFRSPAMRLMFGIGFVFQGVIYTFMTFLVPLLVDVAGLSTTAAIAVLGAVQFVTIATRPALGWLSDVWRAPNRAYYLVVLAAVVGAVMLASEFELSSVIHVGVLACGGAAGFAWIGIYFARLMEISESTGLGFATGVALVPIKLGGMTIPVGMGLLIDAFSYRIAFFVGGVALIGCAIWWWSLLHRHGVSQPGAT